jgi:hypothetical protein
MEPLKRATKFPSEYEIADIIKRYPGWLTALAEGSIENPETPPTEAELLADHFQSAATEMRVLDQAGMPNRRYLKDAFQQYEPELMNTLRPIIDNRDETSFGVLHHMLSRGFRGNPKDEIKDALHYQQLLGISYLDAAHLVRSFSLYANRVAGTKIVDPRIDPSTLKQHLAIRSVIKTVQEIDSDHDWGVQAHDTLWTSDASLGNGQYTLRIVDLDLMSVALDFPDEIDSICRVMVDRKITNGPEVRSLAESVVEVLRSGASPALITGTL